MGYPVVPLWGGVRLAASASSFCGASFDGDGTRIARAELSEKRWAGRTPTIEIQRAGHTHTQQHLAVYTWTDWVDMLESMLWHG